MLWIEGGGTNKSFFSCKIIWQTSYCYFFSAYVIWLWLSNVIKVQPLLFIVSVREHLGTRTVSGMRTRMGTNPGPDFSCFWSKWLIPVMVSFLVPVCGLVIEIFILEMHSKTSHMVCILYYCKFILRQIYCQCNYHVFFLLLILVPFLVIVMVLFSVTVPVLVPLYFWSWPWSWSRYIFWSRHTVIMVQER